MKKALSLLELLITVMLISVITVAFFSLHLFTINQQKSSNRQTILQNEVSHALEHITKTLQQATGNTQDSNNYPVREYADTKGIIVKQLVFNETTNATEYRWIGYRHEKTGTPATNSEIIMHDYGQYPPESNMPHTTEVLSRKIKTTDITDNPDRTSWGFSWAWPLTSNNLDVTIRACWEPDEICPSGVTCACASTDNPSVEMHTNIKMPAVSSN